MTSPTRTLFRLKITLRYIKPPIWRRILVPSDFTFGELHGVIQSCMGWAGYHLHRFEIRRYAKYIYIGPRSNRQRDDDCMEGDDAQTLDENEMPISHFMDTPKNKVYYVYDFGDNWEHEVLLEEILPEKPNSDYPVCLKGKRASPPEDCGGVGGYENLLYILKNPKHKEYKEMVDFVKSMKGDNFDPEKFEPSEVVFSLLF